ncbi:tyrosine protein phosphatase [Natronosporangium hydrolyticum]|uniref:Tyrosine protein phosphatase n=1 Tax=Natronosporangium hydrolyticum TaxID=2811111 RepID=A0A895YDW1_9ACTN|nr:tyrosine protein phosphatase [Natronosporangium hydrolyticum]QSB13589.1 tyrosine protein phosphatase [Natronosporangium hydrolyticum]
MRATLHLIDGPGPGRLATMAHPAGGEQLSASMTALAEAGVATLVCALTDDELARLELTGAPGAAATAGLTYVRFPIPDRTTPQAHQLPAVSDLADQLAGEVRAGRYVATHCWAGIGRSSLLAGATLVRLGFSPAESWQRIRAARGLPVPDSADQERWLFRFAEAE